MRLSIITVNYNNKTGLQRTIDSVLCQTWNDYEWIIIDGGSTDGSRELIEHNQQHFTYWCCEPDNGVYHAMNKGIAKANGEYLNFMNSGDFFYDNEVLHKVFGFNPNGDVIYGDWYDYSDGKSYYHKAPADVTLDYFYSENICHQAMFIKACLLKEEGYDERFLIYADWAKWMALYLQGFAFCHIPIVICYYDATSGLSRKPSFKERDIIREFVPHNIRSILDYNICLKKELEIYQQNALISDTRKLMEERRLYQKCIRWGINGIKYLKYTLDYFHL
jgi:glycosyltransferase involved in cell wall biosynthesis